MMKKTTFLSLIMVLGCNILTAQVNLKGIINNQTGMMVRQLSIEYWNEDRWQQAGSVPLNEDRSFTTALLSPTPGQYRLRMFGQNKVWAEFIIPDSSMAEQTLVFDIDYTQMDGRPARMIGSPANDLYADLINTYRLRSEPDATPATVLELNRKCLEIIKKYRKSLLGDIALLLYEPQKEDFAKDKAVQKMTANEFAKAYALSKLPFEHENVLHHNAFAKALNKYYDYFDRDEKGENAYIDGIMARRNGSEAVDGFLFRFLLEKLMESKSDQSLSYLLKWYTPDCPDEEPLPSNTQNMLEALKICAPGNLAPDLNFSNVDGQMVNLGAVCAQNKLTMLLFWRSTCSHCKEFEPELVNLYQKYHTQGLEVYALSSDRNIETLRGALAEKPTPWINVFIPKEQREDIGRKFPAPSTPTIIVLDKKRRVVSRVLSRNNLDAYLERELAKQK